ncbi:hypothetical protein AM274_26020 [Pseudomonas nunensis]|nr:hypothetical protein AM274_26020 [Pseudomonas nunensis]
MAPSIEVKSSFRNLNKRGAEFYSGLVKKGKDSDTNHLWRGSLLPLGREVALSLTAVIDLKELVSRLRAATQPSGSKLPRHNRTGS